MFAATPARLIARNLLVAGAYGLFGYAAWRVSAAHDILIAPYWPAASVAIVALLRWGATCLPGVFVGSFIVNVLFFEVGTGVALGMSIGNVLGPWLGYVVIRRYTESGPLFQRLRSVSVFVAAGALLHGAVAGVIGSCVLLLAGRIPAELFGATLGAWVVSTSAGALLFAPALLLWLDSASDPSRPTAGPIKEALVVGTTLIGAMLMFFGFRAEAHAYSSLPYLLIVPILWLTVRRSARSGLTMVSLIAVIAALATLDGSGPFNLAGATRPILSLNLMVISVSIAVLVIAALDSQRQAAMAALRESRDYLELRVAQRTRDLEVIASTDALTGLLNRSAVLEFATQNLHETGGDAISLAIIDIDLFKSINDSHGHSVGDAALRFVVQRMCAELTPEQRLGRLGGEEFLLVHRGDGAREACERIRASVARDVFRHDSAEHRLTISVGLSSGKPGEGLDQVMHRADTAMYRAKAQGRNRVVESDDARAPSESRRSEELLPR